MHTNPHWSCEWQCSGRALVQFKLGNEELALFLPDDVTNPTDTELVSVYDLAFPGQVPFSRQPEPRTKPTN